MKFFMQNILILLCLRHLVNEACDEFGIGRKIKLLRITPFNGCKSWSFAAHHPDVEITVKETRANKPPGIDAGGSLAFVFSTSTWEEL